MRRKLLILSMLFCILLPFSVSAAEPSTSLEGFKCSKGGYIPEEFDEKVTEYKENDANMAEKFMTSQLQNLWNIGDVNGLSTLIFGNPYCVWADKAFKDESEIKMAPDGIFTLDERKKIINPLLAIFSSMYVGILVLSMMISGAKLGFTSLRGRGLADFAEDTKMWILSLLFIVSYTLITNLIFEANASLVLALKSLLETNGIKVNAFSIMADWKTDLTGGIPVLSFLITVIAEWILALILNFVYIARKVIIMVLLILGYFAAYSLLFARSRAFFGTWLRELIGNVFIQSIHAILLYGMASLAALGAGATYKLGLMMMFIPLTGMISKWLKIGDTSTKLGSSMTMMGLGGVMTTMALTSQAGNIMRGGSMRTGDMMNSNSFDSKGNTFNEKGLAGFGGGSDSSLTSISTDASGANSSAFMSTKNALSNIGGAIFGTAGMVAGPGGAMVAGTVGKNVTGALIQAPRNIASGINNMANTFAEGKGFTNVAGQTGMKALMGNLGERRAFFGNMGESAGTILGLGVAGRKLGHAVSGVSRQRLMASSPAIGGAALLDKNGNPTAPSMRSLAQQYPGSDMRYIQTNKESGLYMKNPQTQSWQQVGLKGAADPTLTAGAARVVDYKLADGNNGFELQANGSYKASNFNGGSAFQSNSAGITSFKGAAGSTMSSDVGSIPSFNSNSSGGASSLTAPSSISGLGTTSGQNSGGVASSITPFTRPGSTGGSATTIGNQNLPTGTSGKQIITGMTPLSSESISSTSGTVPSGPSLQRTSTRDNTANAIDTFNPMIGPSSSGGNIQSGLGGNSDTVTGQPSHSARTQESVAPIMPTSSNSANSSEQASYSTRTFENVTPSMPGGGLPGSTPDVMRQSNAYIVGTGGSGTVTPAIVNQVASSTVKYEDTTFNAARVNPDSFVAHSIPGMENRSGSDKAADKMNRVYTKTNEATEKVTGKVKSSWVKKGLSEKKERSRRVI